MKLLSLNMKFNKSCHVLVYFHEENQFSILRLKDVLKPTEFEAMDFSRWDKKKSIEVKWGNDMYPANLLQFGGKFWISYFLTVICVPPFIII